MNGLQDLPTIIFAILTLFVLYKLRSILGTSDDGFIDRSLNKHMVLNSQVDQRDFKWNDKWSSVLENPSILKPKILDLMLSYPSFDPLDFINGAKSAYELTLLSFAKGDKITLKQYVSQSVFDNFLISIDDRMNKKQTLELKIIGEEKIEIVDIKKTDNQIEISVYFHMSINQIIKNDKNETLNKPNEQIVETNDIWVFSKNINDNNPNWLLIATQIKASL